MSYIFAMATSQTSAATYLRNGRVMFSMVGEDFVALDVERGQCFGMADVTAEVWRLLETPHNLSDLSEKLQTIYQVSEQECLADLSSLLADMQASGLITIHN